MDLLDVSKKERLGREDAASCLLTVTETDVTRA